MVWAERPFGHMFRLAALICAMVLGVLAAVPARAAPYAAHMMDARTGQTLFESNADTPLHPASLTKMLTLYIAFEEIERGRLSLDSMITVSKNAAAQPPSRLGLKAGQRVQLRYLIRAAAIKSANDAAQAIGDAIGGNQAEFAKRMNQTARALGMRHSTFKNANGLTAKGHLSTARDMSILGQRLFYDFPQYYNIFSRRQTDAGLADVNNTNRKFLDSYKGADGIKTGYTGAAGFNLTASAERGNVRLIATIFGAQSTPDRNAKMAKLLDQGFAMAKGDIGVAAAFPQQNRNADDDTVAHALPEDALTEGDIGNKTKKLRINMRLTSSPRPMPRPDMSEISDETQDMVADMAVGIAGALAEATQTAVTDVANLPFAVAPNGGVPVQLAPEAAQTATASAPQLRPAARPNPPQIGQIEVAPSVDVAATLPQQTAETQPPARDANKPKRNAPIYDTAKLTAALPANNPNVAASLPDGEIVTRLSTSGEKHWGINVGRFETSDAAERILVKMQLVESATLGQSLRKVTQKGGGYDANFLGLTQEAAALACRRLDARAIPCIQLGP
jgi:D-alanyl-D-alanine carboxypeptidase